MRWVCPWLAFVFGCGQSWKIADLDGDGYTPAEGDCWDDVEGPEGSGLSGDQISPGADETWYDGIDQNCDGLSDFDADGDGSTPAGFGVGSGDDCDDADALSYPGALDTWYDGVDSDCGGEDDYDQDGDGHAATGYDGNDGDDCDDLDAAINPESEENWYDGVDQDCDGNDDDQDGDGYPLTEDCDDTDDTKVPDGSLEDWSDCDDDNCDGNAGDQDDDGYVSDEFVATCPDWEIHNGHRGAGDCWDSGTAADHDAVPVNDFPVLTAGQVSPEAVETWYDGVDQDCAGDDDFDQDADGFRTDEYPDTAGETGEDCDDGDPDINPREAETWYDGVDSDCAGDDDYDQDYDGYQAEGTGEGSDDDCDDTVDDINPGVTEECATSYDDDCDGDNNDLNANDCSSFYMDGDGDSYGAGSASCACVAPGTSYVTNDDDCNDSSASINPGATETVGDEVDQTCDNKEKCYVDADDDGYRTTSTSSTVTSSDSDCDDAGEAASSLPATDCDDTDDTINPSETEVVGDEIDQTCDSQEKCYVDADNDEFRTTSTSSTVTSSDSDCDDSGEAASSLPATDCDDTDDTVYPGASEVCEDGVVNDCEGDVASAQDACLDPTYALGDADLARYSTAASEDAGTWVALGGDLTGDGVRDVLVGAPIYNGYQGEAYVLPGPLTRDTSALGGSGVQILGEDSVDSRLGICGDLAGDLDDDGISDLLLGAYDMDTTDTSSVGAAYVIYGPISSGFTLGSGTYDLRLVGEDSADRLGYRVAMLGDVNLDGTDDAVVTCYSCEAVEGMRDSEGTLYVFLGAPASSATPDTADAILTGVDTIGYMGYALAAAGDVDGDGAADLIAGAYGVNDGAATDAGAAYLFLSPSSGTTSAADADWTVTGTASGDDLGYGVAGGGDVDGDGLADQLVGAIGVDAGASAAGATWLFLGAAGLSGSVGPSAAAAALIGDTASDQSGSALTVRSDIDGDSYADILIGVRYSDINGSSSGAGYLFYGPVSGTLALSAADVVFSGEASGDSAGFAVAGGGDVDADGRDDLALGSPNADPSGLPSAGQVNFILGTSY